MKSTNHALSSSEFLIRSSASALSCVSFAICYLQCAIGCKDYHGYSDQCLLQEKMKSSPPGVWLQSDKKFRDEGRLVLGNMMTIIGATAAEWLRLEATVLDVLPEDSDHLSSLISGHKTTSQMLEITSVKLSYFFLINLKLVPVLIRSARFHCSSPPPLGRGFLKWHKAKTK